MAIATGAGTPFIYNELYSLWIIFVNDVTIKMNTVKMIFVILIACAAAYYAYLGCKLLPSKSSDKAEFAKLNAAISESARIQLL